MFHLIRQWLKQRASVKDAKDVDLFMERMFLTDGSTTWMRCGEYCDLQVVRPGKVQCDGQDPACPNRKDDE